MIEIPIPISPIDIGPAGIASVGPTRTPDCASYNTSLAFTAIQGMSSKQATKAIESDVVSHLLELQRPVNFIDFVIREKEVTDRSGRTVRKRVLFSPDSGKSIQKATNMEEKGGQVWDITDRLSDKVANTPGESWHLLASPGEEQSEDHRIILLHNKGNGLVREYFVTIQSSRTVLNKLVGNIVGGNFDQHQDISTFILSREKNRGKSPITLRDIFTQFNNALDDKERGNRYSFLEELRRDAHLSERELERRNEEVGKLVKGKIIEILKDKPTLSAIGIIAQSLPKWAEAAERVATPPPENIISNNHKLLAESVRLNLIINPTGSRLVMKPESDYQAEVVLLPKPATCGSTTVMEISDTTTFEVEERKRNKQLTPRTSFKTPVIPSEGTHHLVRPEVEESHTIQAWGVKDPSTQPAPSVVEGVGMTKRQNLGFEIGSKLKIPKKEAESGPVCSDYLNTGDRLASLDKTIARRGDRKESQGNKAKPSEKDKNTPQEVMILMAPSLVALIRDIISSDKFSETPRLLSGLVELIPTPTESGERSYSPSLRAGGLHFESWAPSREYKPLIKTKVNEDLKIPAIPKEEKEETELLTTLLDLIPNHPERPAIKERQIPFAREHEAEKKKGQKARSKNWEVDIPTAATEIIKILVITLDETGREKQEVSQKTEEPGLKALVEETIHLGWKVLYQIITKDQGVGEEKESAVKLAILLTTAVDPQVTDKLRYYLSALLYRQLKILKLTKEEDLPARLIEELDEFNTRASPLENKLKELEKRVRESTTFQQQLITAIDKFLQEDKEEVAAKWNRRKIKRLRLKALRIVLIFTLLGMLDFGKEKKERLTHPLRIHLEEIKRLLKRLPLQKSKRLKPNLDNILFEIGLWRKIYFFSSSRKKQTKKTKRKLFAKSGIIYRYQPYYLTICSTSK